MSHTELPHHHEGNGNFDFIDEHLGNIDDFQTVSEVFRQLGDPTRLRIFWLLCHCEECVINISALMGMSSPAVSHHLRALKDSGLIQSRRDGKEVYYSAKDTDECHLLHLIIEDIMAIKCITEPLDTDFIMPGFPTGAEHHNDDEIEDACGKPVGSGSGYSAGGFSSARAEYISEHNRQIREIHDYLLENMSERITIQDLAKRYLMNPTTLKASFKEVYGKSLASHIKEHRMEYAAKLLTETDMSISEIAKSVGYDSQSRFSDAFKSNFSLLPTEYRRKNRG